MTCANHLTHSGIDVPHSLSYVKSLMLLNVRGFEIFQWKTRNQKHFVLPNCDNEYIKVTGFRLLRDLYM